MFGANWNSAVAIPPNFGAFDALISRSRASRADREQLVCHGICPTPAVRFGCDQSRAYLGDKVIVASGAVPFTRRQRFFGFDHSRFAETLTQNIRDGLRKDRYWAKIRAIDFINRRSLDSRWDFWESLVSWFGP